MVQVPRYPGQRAKAERARLVTDGATVTLHEPMDRSRNRAVLDALHDQVAEVGEESWVEEVKRGADYDWPTLYGRLRKAGASPETMDAVRTLAARVDRPYPSLLRMRVRPDTPIDFVAGQYVTLRAHGTPRAYSIANAPGEDELEFAIRRVPGGRLTSDLFVHVDEGDEVVVRGPNGHMVLEEPSQDNLVFLATGTGVAPFKSMIDHLYAQGWDEGRDVWLFLGCGWADDLPYREAFRERAASHDNFHFVPTLTREHLLTAWDGETDYVQQTFVTYLAEGALGDVELPRRLAPFRDAEPALDVDARIDPNETELYACGITAMVSTLVRCARAVGVPPSEMQFEGFG